MARRALLCALSAGLALAAGPVFALDIDLSGNVDLEWRHFTKPGSDYAGADDPLREQDFASVSGELELGLFSRSGNHAVVLKPFGRYDQHDHERSHADLREAKYRYLRGSAELTVGVDKEFWGVTEFQHLVDIINQTDNVESVDGEAKLGQPMVKLAWSSRYGTLTGYALPFFRIRQYADPVTGRPNLGFVVDDSTTLFESGEGRRTDDYALRYKHSFGPFDVGLSWFDGTARAPQLLLSQAPGATGLANNLPEMQAYYAYFEQAGLDVQATLGPWLLKLEAAQSTENRFTGANPTLLSPQKEVTANRTVSGFEYTFYGLVGAGDLGLVAEYMWDERTKNAPHPFGNDVGIGLRLTLNDTQSTAILFGGLVDLDNDSTSLSLEAERRIGASFKAILEARVQDKVGADDRFASANADEDFIRLRFGWYF